jgi:hypothetical protein
MDFGLPITRFALAPLGVDHEQWKGKCELICEGRQTGTFVPGCDLKAQYQTDRYFLLITQYDCLFEESVSVTLLSEDLRLLASSTVPQIIYPVIGAPSYFFEKLVWHDTHHFDLYIEDEPLIYRYKIRDSAIPLLRSHLRKRVAKRPV